MSSDRKPPSIKIREMIPEDLEEIVTMESSSAHPPWSKKLFERELQLSIARHLVAKMEGQETNCIAGYTIFWIVAGELQIHNVVVREDLRRMGIAESLIKEVIRRSRLEGAIAGTLEVRRSNRDAIKLYENFGFMVKGVRTRYYTDNGEDALIMWANLADTHSRLL